MSENWLQVFNNAINPNNIISIKQCIKKTGEIFAKATKKDGKTLIKSLSPLDVEKNMLIEIPSYASKLERNKIIQELSKNFTQDDIADMLDISQSTVSNVLKSFKK